MHFSDRDVNPELYRAALRMLTEGKGRETILAVFRDRGVPEPEAHKVYAIAYDFYVAHIKEYPVKMRLSVRAQLWLLAAITILVFFAWVIPLHGASMTVGIIGAFGFCICLFFALIAARTPADWKGRFDERNINRFKHGWILFIVFFFSLMLMDQVHVHRKFNARHNESVVTVATVRDGSGTETQYTNGTSSSYYLDLEFTDTYDKKFNSKVKVDGALFNSVHAGQRLIYVYCIKERTMDTVMIDTTNLRFFSGPRTAAFERWKAFGI